MIDFHSHVLPCMDDGSRSVQESLRMLRSAASQGIPCMAATPHFYAEKETPETFLDRRERSEAMLREGMENQQGLPRILPGAEVRYYEGFSRTLALNKLVIRNTRLLLLEMPFVPWTERMLQEVRNAQEQLDVTVVLAHIERYLPMQNGGPRFWDQLEELGVLVQANAGFFIRIRDRGKALRLLRQDRIHLLGSDCHNTRSRPPNLGRAVSIINNRLSAKQVRGMEGREKRLLNINIVEKGKDALL